MDIHLSNQDNAGEERILSLEAIATRLEDIAIRLKAVAIRLKAIASTYQFRLTSSKSSTCPAQTQPAAFVHSHLSNFVYTLPALQSCAITRTQTSSNLSPDKCLKPPCLSAFFSRADGNKAFPGRSLWNWLWPGDANIQSSKESPRWCQICSCSKGLEVYQNIPKYTICGRKVQA